MVLRKWLSSLINGRPHADRPRRRSLNQPQRDMRAAAQLSAEPLEQRQLLTASIAGIDPDHGVDATDELTNLGTFNLYGTAAGDSVLQITRNGNFVGAILVNSDGEWRFAQTNLAAGTYQYSANDGEGASALTVLIDKTAPTASLSTSLSLANPTNAETLPISLNFSEAVDGLTLSDLAIGNGTASNLLGSGSSYSFDVTPTSDGAVTIGLNANKVIDLAGNSNPMSATLSIDSDRTAPVAPSVSDPSGSGVTNSGSVTVAGSADAGSLVRLYRDADASGTLSEGDTPLGQQQLGSSETSFSFSTGLNSDAANLFLLTATDSATNESVATAVPTITQDSTSPSAAIVFGVTDPTNATSIPVTVNFSEAVSGFDAGDVVIGNGSISDFVSVSSTQATFNVTQAADGNVTIDIAAAAAVDLAGNASNAASQASIVSDTTKPTVSFTPSIDGVSNVSVVGVTVAFSESVSGFDLSDLAITNGSASDLTGSGSSYSFNLTPAADGEVIVSLAGGSVADAAGNTNDSAELQIRSDRTAPSAPSVSSPATDVATNATSFNITGTISPVEDTLVRVYRDVDGSGTLNVGDSSVGEQLLLGGDSFSIAVPLTANSTNRFLVTSTDGVGNVSVAAVTSVITQDSIAPQTSISVSSAAITNAATIAVAVSFTEDVIGFDASDVSVSNGAVSDFVAVDGSHYTLNVTPNGDGLVTIDVAAGVASDAGGNANEAATQCSFESDRTAPVITLAPSVEKNVNGWNNTDVTVSYSVVEANIDAEASDSTDDILTASGTASATVTDLAGNSTTVSYETLIDKVAPTLTAARDISANENGWNNSDVTITFEASDDLSGGVSSPAAQVFSDGFDQTASATVTDLAGNTTTVSIEHINVDKVAPTLTASRDISANANGWNNSDVTVTFEASDDLSGGVSSPSAQVFSDGFDQTASATVTDLAGNSTTVSIEHINVDKIAPTLTASRDISANENGWNNSDVTVAFEASDELSGGVTSPAAQVFSDGFDQTASATVTDLAGNSTSISIEHINVDQVAPTLTASRDISGNENGWNNSDVTVTFDASDALSGGVSSPAAQVFSDGFDQTASATVTDLAGNSTTVSIEHINVDKVAPTLTASRDIAANENGWNNSEVTVTFEASDELSGGVSSPAAQVFSDGFDQTASATVTDLAGNSTSVSIEHISVDQVAPELTASRVIEPNENGWNNTDVTVRFETYDALSGGVSGPFFQEVGEGFNQTASATVTDLAGNSTSVSIEHINVDKTAPTLTVVEAPTEGQEGSELLFAFSTSDELSGLYSASVSAFGGPRTIGSLSTSSLGVTPLDNGLYLIGYSVTDEAGNSSSISYEFDIANVAPTAGDDSYTLTGDAGDDNVGPITEDTVLEGEGLLDNDFDPAGANDPLTIIGYDTFSEHGAAVTVNSDGSFTYDPTVSEDAQSLGAGEVGIDTFGYTISDGDGATTSATVSVEVHGVNEAPVLNDTTAVRLEAIDANDIYNQGVDIETFALDRIDEVDANDSIGIAVIGFSRATTRGNWQFSTNNGTSWTTISGTSEANALHLVADGQTRLRLRPDGSHTGTARLTVRAWDGSNGNAVGNGGYSAITGTGNTAAYSSDMLTLRQTVLSAARDATIAVSDTFEVDENGEISGSVLSNDIDPDSRLPQDVSVHFESNLDLGLLGQLFGAPEGMDSVGITHVGVLTHNRDGSFSYQAEPEFFASLPAGESVLDGFSYFVTDGRLTSNIAGVAIILTGVNDAPTADEIYEVSVDENEELSLPSLNELFHDVDTGDSLTLSISDADGDALPDFFAFDADTGTLTVSPDQDSSGIYTVVVTATDLAGAAVSTQFDVSVNDTVATIHVVGQANDPNEAWSLFVDDNGLFHITRNGTDAVDPLPIEHVFAVYLDAGEGDDSVSLSASLNVVTDGNDENDGAGDGEGDDEGSGLFINLGAGNDSINATAAAFSVVVFGGEGHDLMLGGSASDFFFGEAGNDTLLGAGGDDLLLGGDGSDTLRGGAGSDSLDGGAENDLVVGQGGGDLLLGGTGDDTVDGGVGNDSMLGNDGNDSLIGGTGNDVVIGGTGNDTLLGNEGTDILIGGSGADSLSGGNNPDIGLGGEGDTATRGGVGQSDEGDSLGADLETVNETFAIKFDWELNGLIGD
ncbi:MAG: Ig-like domain-containing protein [Planctomycetaceae bacterium]